MIRWGIWATGTIARQVASDFRLVRGAALHAVASRKIERAKSFASRYGVVRFYEGLEPLLRDPEVAAIYIATPNHRHLADCLACIEAGKAVLCEKPFALSLAQAQRIVTAARERRVFCMEAMWTRFIPAVVEAKRWIDSGAIGAVRLVQGNFAYPVLAGPNSRFFDPKLGGGALLDRGVYLISIAQHLLGSPQSVRGIACIGASGVDEQSAYQLVWPDGAMADLSASLRVYGSNELIIAAEDGLLRLPEPFYRAHRLILKSHPRRHFVADGPDPPKTRVAQKIFQTVHQLPAAGLLQRRLGPLLTVFRRGRVRTLPFAGNGYQFELSEVTRCLREKRTESPVMSLDDSLAVMRTMDALRLQWGLTYPQEGSC